MHDTKRVLVVDPSESLRHLCGYVILSHDLLNYDCCNVEQAFEAFGNLDVHLVVTSLHFHHYSGVDLAHRVKTARPDVDVIMMIDVGDVMGAVQAMRGGADDIMIKPFSTDELRSKLRLWQGRCYPFNAWARNERGREPDIKRLSPDWREDLIALAEKCAAPQDEPRNQGLAVIDAARTFGQILSRDLEEVALMANVSVDFVRAAFMQTEYFRALIAP